MAGDLGQQSWLALRLRDFGFLPDEWSEKDKLFVPQDGTKEKSSVDLRSGNDRGYWGPVYDQTPFQSCVANATAAVATYEWNKQQAGAAVTTVPAFSRIFIWYNARDASPYVPKPVSGDTGCHIRIAMRTLHKDGVCHEILCQYPKNIVKRDPATKAKTDAYVQALKQCNQEPDLKAYKDAETFRIIAYQRLDVKRRPDDKEKIRNTKDIQQMEEDGKVVGSRLRLALPEGHPVVFGYSHFERLEFSTVDSTGMKILNARPKSRRHTPPTEDEQRTLGAHAVVAVGYDDKYVKCLTSYGVGDWPDGCFLMPWDWITDFEATEDFWIMRGFQ